MSVSLEEELRWCSDGALTILTLRGSRSGSCLWEDRCWEPRCVMTGWKRTSGKPPFFTDEQQHCRSGLFFPSFWKWQGICLRTLSRSRSSSKFEHRDDCSDGVCREELRPQLCSASTTPISLVDSLPSPQ